MSLQSQSNFDENFLLIRKFYLVIVFVFVKGIPLFGVGTQFLSIPSTAYELALGINPSLKGESFSNPAALDLSSSSSQIFISQGSWLAGVREMAFRISKGQGGIQLRYSGISDLELRSSIPSDDPLAQFGAYGVSLGGFYKSEFGDGYFIGVSMKAIGFQIYDNSSSGFAADIGFAKMIRKNINLGLSILNLGSMSSLLNTPPNLPVRILGGINYLSSFVGLEHRTLVSFERSSLSPRLLYRFGNELQWNKLSIQMGVQSSEKVNSFSAGLGLELGAHRLQYGIQIGSHDLGFSQMLDLSIYLP